MKRKANFRITCILLKKLDHYSVLGLFTLTIVVNSINLVLARDYFNPGLLNADVLGDVNDNLSVFETAGSQLPGVYTVKVFVNDKYVKTDNIEFVKNEFNEESSTLHPCLTFKQLYDWGVRPEIALHEKCVDLKRIKGARADFLFDKLLLNIHIPQVAMNKFARGSVSPADWDEGIPAVLLDYSITGYDTRYRTGSYSNKYVNLHPGINLGGWRLRNYTIWNNNRTGSYWSTPYTYLRHDIVPLRSYVVLGDGNTTSSVFDSIPFRGGMITSSEEMLPDSLRGFAPVVQGVARSDAEVIIRQNGYVIYRDRVSQGEFRIDDLNAVAMSGDLEVTVRESDGREQVFSVPWASLPAMQREGHLKYGLSAGEYRPYSSSIDKRLFTQFTLEYGLPHGLTLYGGGQNAGSIYSSVSIGAGKDMGGAGAVSADVTSMQARPYEYTMQRGESVRIRYAKNLPYTGTDIAIAGYRYSTSDYWSLSQALNTYNSYTNPAHKHFIDNTRTKHRAELTLTQRLPSQRWGRIAVNLIKEKGWRHNDSQTSAHIGYYANLNTVNIGVSYSRTHSNSYISRDYSPVNATWQLSLSMPFSSGNANTWASYSLQSSENSPTSQTVSLSGLMEHNSVNWDAYANEAGANGNGYGANVKWYSPFTTLSGGVSQFNHAISTRYGAQGGAIAHAGGITLSPSLGETNALVSLPNIDGAHLSTHVHAVTDKNGFAVAPRLRPYKLNTISMDTEALPENADILTVSQKSVPTWGAVTLIPFKATQGTRLLLTLLRENGSPVPFGASVYISSLSTVMVGPDGQTYISSAPDVGTLTAHWSNNEFCKAEYDISQAQITVSSLYEMVVICKQ